MFSSNPFVELSSSISPGAMQGFVILMAVLVIAGTLFDVIHKKSAQYFFENWKPPSSAAGAKRQRRRNGVDRGQDRGGRRADFGGVLQCASPHRAPADHVRVRDPYRRNRGLDLRLPDARTPTPVSGPCSGGSAALMVCAGGYWFWFFIRVDVAAEGSSPLALMRADLFILSLLASVTLALLWAWTQGSGVGWLLLRALHRLDARCCSAACPGPSSRTCSSSPRRPSRRNVTKANGSAGKPADADRADDPEQQAKILTFQTCCATRRRTWAWASSAKPRHY